MKIKATRELNIKDIVSLSTDATNKINIYYKSSKNINLKKFDPILDTEIEKGLFRYCDDLIETRLNEFLILEEGQAYFEK